MDNSMTLKEKTSPIEFRERIRSGYKWVLIFAVSAGVLVGIYHSFLIRWFGMMEFFAYLYLLISLFLPLAFLIFPARKGTAEKNISRYDIVLSILSFAIPFYFFLVTTEATIYSAWELTPRLDGFIGALILWLLVLEAARRASGLGLVVLVGILSIYPLFAGSMPGILYGYQFSLRETVGIHAFSLEGMIGAAMQVYGRLLLGYMLFGITMKFTGAGAFFIALATALLGHVRGGPAKVAILSSGFFGSISGSAFANIMVTGSFTIPTMKRIGYSSHYAAAVETCASVGGQITPPIMASVAFLIAQWLGISYLYVVVVAVIPAIIYYVSLMVQVDGYAAQHNLKGLPREECPRLWPVLKGGWIYPIVFAVLLFLMFKMLMVAQAPYIATALMLPLSMIRKETRLTLETVVGLFVDLGEALARLLALCLAVGLIIGGIMFTGIATSIGSEIMVVVGYNLALVVIVSAIALVIMGMGAATLICYILGALLLAPSLVKVGIPVLAAHFFIMYYTNLSNLTPPVCLGAYAAAGLANAPPMKTGFMATRIGLILFIIPVFFLIRPELLLIGTPLMIALAMVEALVGTIMIASALEGYLLKVGRLNVVSRLLLGAGGFVLLFPAYYCTLIGIGLIAGSVILGLAVGKMK